MSGYCVPRLPLLVPGELPSESSFVFFEEEIKRSRFLTWLAHIGSREGALAMAAFFRGKYPDARHCCWAYLAGPPGDTARVGQSDDGEPHGTAGRPMLARLLASGVGEIAAVTVRYFGGIKLGTGGLSRAYGNGVDQALALLPVTEKKVFRRVLAEMPYSRIEAFRRLLPRFGGRIVSEEYGAAALFEAEIPEDALEACRKAWEDATEGREQIVLL